MRVNKNRFQQVRRLPLPCGNETEDLQNPAFLIAERRSIAGLREELRKRAALQLPDRWAPAASPNTSSHIFGPGMQSNYAPPLPDPAGGKPFPGRTWRADRSLLPARISA